jgi:hypothetical protein
MALNPVFVFLAQSHQQGLRLRDTGDHGQMARFGHHYERVGKKTPTVAFHISNFFAS